RPDRNLVNHFSVFRRAGIHVGRDELVRSVTQTLLSQGPDVEIVFLPSNEIADVRRVAGFIRARERDGAERERNEPSSGAKPVDRHEYPPVGARKIRRSTSARSTRPAKSHESACPGLGLR